MATVTIPEQLFLSRWKSIDFAEWNETEVREGFIIDLLHTLGYRKGTTYDLEMEKPLTLAKPYHRIGREKVNIDYAPAIRKRYFWIVEAKPGKAQEMKMGDLLQAHLYAVHPEVQARLVVLANGWQVRVYDALTLSSWDDPLLVVNQSDKEEVFVELREMLGAPKMLAYQRKRLLDIVRTTLESEVDIGVLDNLAGELFASSPQMAGGSSKRTQKLWMSSMKKHFDDEEAELRKDTTEVLFVKMDLPTDGRPHPAREFVRRIVQAGPPEQARLVDELAMHYRGRPHNIFRVLALHAFVDLAEAGIVVPRSSYVTSISGCIDELAQAEVRLASREIEVRHRGHHLEPDLRQLVARPLRERRDEVEREAGRCGEAHDAAGLGVRARDDVVDVACRFGHPPRWIEDALAERRQARSVDRAGEERLAQARLQVGELAAHRGLGDLKDLGRPAQAPSFGYGEDHLDFAPVDMHLRMVPFVFALFSCVCAETRLRA